MIISPNTLDKNNKLNTTLLEDVDEAVEVEEEEKSGGWQPQKSQLKKQKKMEKAAVKEVVDKIEGEQKRDIEMMKAVVGDEGEVKRMFIGVVEEVATIGMNFQVCEVKKALAAVRRICKAGNVVQFGSEPEECYIESKMSRKRVMLRQKGGSYVMDVEFVREGDGGTMYVSEITVDSRAEESVCLVEWGKEFGTKVAAEKMGLVNAGGGTIRHVGSRRVTFKSVGF